VSIDDVACRHPVGRGDVVERARSHAVVFVRRGTFMRSGIGQHALLDPTVAYCANPGEEECYGHPLPGGDDCTAIHFEPNLAASLAGGESTLPSLVLRTSPQVDLEHRLLLAGARRRDDPDELAERAITLAAATLEQTKPNSLVGCRPPTADARRTIVSGARELLAADPSRSLSWLARELAVSSHHLSRVFRAVTGSTISRHRIRLRARAAMERLADGERDLAWLAADLGFADQSHLHRTIRAETGRTPTALRKVLGSAERVS
jgi:AraC-like DNA-binding protein